MEFIKEENRIYSTDDSGSLLAEITFPEKESGVFFGYSLTSCPNQTSVAHRDYTRVDAAPDIDCVERSTSTTNSGISAIRTPSTAHPVLKFDSSAAR